MGDVDAANWYGAQLIAVRWAQGRVGELLGLVDELDQSGTVPELGGVSTAALAVVAASAGDEVTARSALARLGAGRLGGLPRGSVWLVTMAAVCDAANALADAEAASEAYELLAPFADLPVLVGLGVACFGSVHRPLGIAALTFGNIDLAIDHLDRRRWPPIWPWATCPPTSRRWQRQRTCSAIATTRVIRRGQSGCKRRPTGTPRSAR